MHVFVTGAAGFIGRAVVKELLSNGHQVLGLTRNDAHVDIITKLGAIPHRGDLEDIESLKSGAAATDGVIHLAFIHDFSNFARSIVVDLAAIEAMGEVLMGTGKPLIIASGTMGVPKGVLATEDTEAEHSRPGADRAKAADVVKDLSKDGSVRGAVVRLTPTVHGPEDSHGMLVRLAGLAKQKGVVMYIGDGAARWPAVHRLDAAVLFRLVLEKGKGAATYNAVAEEGVPMKDICTVIGKRLQLPVEGKDKDEAVKEMGFLGHIVGADNPTSSEQTQKELGWHPTQTKLLADMEANYPF